jgi:hypothetical protein
VTSSLTYLPAGPRPIAHPVRRRRAGLVRGRLDEFWPLTVYFYLFPLWWVLGLAHLILFILAVPMLWQLTTLRSPRAPQGFGLYALFLVWMMLSVTTLHVRAPDTAVNNGIGPILGFSFRAAWYFSLAIAALYTLNAARDRLTAVRVVRMLAFMFVVTVAGGYAGILFPNVDFPSLLELFLPHQVTQQELWSSLFHPRISLQSDILGYSKPRITAPYAFPNTWGNAFGVLLPFFLLGWFGKGAGWRAYLAPVILASSVLPVVDSLNRGLWVGLGISFAWVVLHQIYTGHLRALFAGLVLAVIGLTVLSTTPLGTTIALRIANPHSNERRQNTALTVISDTAHTSPLLGFGSTREMIGNFTSLSGGGSAKCFQCAAPPLGTQGFMWGLIFMTGFVGAALFIGFLVRHLLLNAGRAGPLALTTSTTLIACLFYFLFYDSLDFPLLVVFVALGLSAREHAPASLHTADLEAAP